jgi:hypothetical protein
LRKEDGSGINHGLPGCHGYFAPRAPSPFTKNGEVLKTRKQRVAEVTTEGTLERPHNASWPYTSPWFVIISALDKRNYSVEYLMPERVAPWSQAYVRGEARSEDDAVQMVVTAMEKSEGWNKSR